MARNSKSELLTDTPPDVVNRAFPAVCHCTLHNYSMRSCKHKLISLASAPAYSDGLVGDR
jgi:hypothetical protein